MILFDFFSFSPANEIFSACQKKPSDEYAEFGSLKGRSICVWKAGYHASGILWKPAFYFVLGIMTIAGTIILKTNNEEPYASNPEQFLHDLRLMALFGSCGFVAPLSQLILLVKAVAGIIHPGFYFKKDELNPYFLQLAAIAKNVGGEESFVQLLEQGSACIEKTFQLNGAKNHYYALIKRDLARICEKMSDPSFDADQKLALLKMLSPDPNDNFFSGSGIHSCPPGLTRIFEQICAALDIPHQPEKVLPWLADQYKVELLNRMIFESAASSGQKNRPKWHKNIEKSSHEPIHRANALIALLGHSIGLPKQMIEQAAKDISIVYINENDKQDILQAFDQLCTENDMTSYFMDKINSGEDGSAGLKLLRNHIIQQLSETVTDEEIESSKEEVINQLHVSEVLADEPIFYVKLHYFLDPNADLSDEGANDINEAGIKAYAETLEVNPFSYFK